MSLLAHEQTTICPRGHDLQEDSEGGWSNYPSDSQTTLNKFNVAKSNRRDNLRLELCSPVLSRTSRKMARATSKNRDVDLMETRKWRIITTMARRPLAATWWWVLECHLVSSLGTISMTRRPVDNCYRTSWATPQQV